MSTELETKMSEMDAKLKEDKKSSGGGGFLMKVPRPLVEKNNRSACKEESDSDSGSSEPEESLRYVTRKLSEEMDIRDKEKDSSNGKEKESYSHNVGHDGNDSNGGQFEVTCTDVSRPSGFSGSATSNNMMHLPIGL